jgi:hypothetical protein
VSGEGVHWTLKQTLAWIADRNLDRVNTAYREWRNRYYEYPQLPDWRSKPPLIWDWRSPVDELDGAAQALRRKCENGALHGTGREGAGAPRREIAPLRWLDLMLVDIAAVTAGPQLYDVDASALAIMDGRAEPIFHDVFFYIAEPVRVVAAPEPVMPGPIVPKATPLMVAPTPELLKEITATYRELSGRVQNKVEADKLVEAKFGELSEDTREMARGAAHFSGIMGRPRKK